MSYEKRLTLAGALSVLLHVAFFALVAVRGCQSITPVNAIAAHREPIVLRLQPPKPPASRRLVDTTAPADEPAGPTDLIGEHTTKAQDFEDVQGTRLAPYFEEPSEFDQLRIPAPMPAPKPSAPAPKGAPETAPTESQPTEAALAALAAPDETHERAPEASREAPPDREPLEVAQADPPVLPPGQPRGRVDGGVQSKGFTGFEAMEDEIAPYLKEVRARVERNWRAALQLRYSGTTPTKAVLECSIRPDGMLEHVRIVEAGVSPSGVSPTYAPLCKEAVERAAPFPAFPFKVPEMYRERSLQIRWTFSFLM